MLYLENHLASGVFTSARIAVLQVLAPLAALARCRTAACIESWRCARLKSATGRRQYRRRRDYPRGRRSDRGERRGSPDRGLYRRRRPVGAATVARPDAAGVAGGIRSGIAQLQATGRFDVFEKEYFRSDGSRVPVLLAGAAVDDARQEMVVFVIDITERKRAELERQKLLQLQADLAHVNRISLMGELAASLSHELKQPVTAAILDANTCLRWLSRDTPDVERACRAATRVVKGATLAASSSTASDRSTRRRLHPSARSST